MDWLYSDGGKIKYYQDNINRFMIEHPNEIVVITNDKQEHFFKTYLEKQIFLNPEKEKEIRRGEKLVEGIIFGPPPLCMRIPDPRSPRNPLLKQSKIPLEFRV